jgi:ATP-dependent protease ClpP protease subunit
MALIRVIGSIDDDAYALFSIAVAEAEDSGEREIDLELCSEGGLECAALAFIARMRTSRCNFIITVYGHAESAATLILAYGDMRRMTSESWVTIHESSATLKKLTTTALEHAVGLQRKMEDQWATILASRTALSKEEWDRMHSGGDRYLTPQECLTVGLIDEII